MGLACLHVAGLVVPPTCGSKTPEGEICSLHAFFKEGGFVGAELHNVLQRIPVMDRTHLCVLLCVMCTEVASGFYAGGSCHPPGSSCDHRGTDDSLPGQPERDGLL